MTATNTRIMIKFYVSAPCFRTEEIYRMTASHSRQDSTVRETSFCAIFRIVTALYCSILERILWRDKTKQECLINRAPLAYILQYFDVFDISVDGSHPACDVHRPGAQHPDKPEGAALHLLCHSDHGLSHWDPGDSHRPGQSDQNRRIFG